MALSTSEAANEDIAKLYRSLSRPLEEIVRFDLLYAPKPVVEDACQFAWDRLIDNHPRVRSESALPWLARTAFREGLKLLRREAQCVSLDETLALAGEGAVEQESPAPDELFERRERLAEIRALPERQQRLVWLHALGLNYSEIAMHTGYSTRTVERQLLRAKRALRKEAE